MTAERLRKVSFTRSISFEASWRFSSTHTSMALRSRGVSTKPLLPLSVVTACWMVSTSLSERRVYLGIFEKLASGISATSTRLDSPFSMFSFLKHLCRAPFVESIVQL